MKQQSKVRAIDDFSASGINDALSAQESIDPADLDKIAANVRAHMDALCASPEDRPAGSPFAAVRRHPDRRGSGLVCKMWDLAAAYRQLARAPKHGSCTVIACWPTRLRRYQFFEQLSLAFGASSSVLSFNWMATALCRIVVGLLRLGSTNFYDDFTVIEETELSESAKKSFELLMQLLGWSLKDLPEFAETAEPLGAVLDLSRAKEGVAVIANKKKRVADISLEIERVLGAGGVTGVELAKLRGRLLFSRSLCFARFGGAALRALGPACLNAGSTFASPELRSALLNLRQYLVQAPPRTIRLKHSGAPVLLTDGSFEMRGGLPLAGIGAILLDPADHACEYFASVVPDSILMPLSSQSKNPIFVVEAIAVLAAKRAWADRLRNRSCLIFIDNEATKAALIACYSPAGIGAATVQASVDLDINLQCLPWYDRVPTASNPADAPSRGDVPPLISGWPAARRVELPLGAASVSS